MLLTVQLVGGTYGGVFRDIDIDRDIYEVGVYLDDNTYSIEVYTRRVFTHSDIWIPDIIVYGIKDMSNDDVWDKMK